MSRRNFIFVLSGAAAVFSAAGLHIVAVRAYSERLERLNAEIAALTDANDQSDILDRLNEVRRYLASHTFEDSGPGQVADILAVLARDLDALGAQDRSWNVGASASVNGFQEVPVNIAFTGSLALTQDLLKRIAGYPGIARVEKLTIRRDPVHPASYLSVAIRLQAVSRVQIVRASQEAL